ncbi:hypothetical protein [Tenacibaculum halocynthiae]|uniref:hypothetical protein n=1 Tax=Tenacibaculum halocynthiae TaxID=1254437 RepID=UPI0038960382
MKLNHPIKVDLLEFFKTGKFDYLKLGQTQEWILNNFPDPDSGYDPDTNESFNIWTYGGIELHFEEGMLFLIYSDYWYEGKLSDTKELTLNKWIFEDIDKLNLLYVLTKLNEENIDYKKKTDNLGVLLRLKSGVELTFGNINDVEGLNTNEYHLTSFALVAENPFRWKDYI